MNGLNAPNKRHRLTEWIQNKSLQESHCRAKDTHGLKVRGWKEIVHANGNDKKASVTIHVSDKIEFKTKAIKKDKVGQYIMIKRSIEEEDFTLINIYAPSIGAPKYLNTET